MIISFIGKVQQNPKIWKKILTIEAQATTHDQLTTYYKSMILTFLIYLKYIW